MQRNCSRFPRSSINFFLIFPQTYTVNGAAVTMPDEWADNGMVQVINKVLFPIPDGAIPTVLADDSEGRFTTLSMCIELSGLSGVLTGKILL